MIAWVDIESTGLDEREGLLLEVAMMVTDDHLGNLAEISHVCGGVTLESIRPLMDDKVWEMHSKNGLLEVVPNALPVSKVEELLISFLEKLFVDSITLGPTEERLKKTPLAGASVGFDRRWLRVHMPRLESMFSYRSIDVSCLTELTKRWAPEIYELRPRSGDEHRALSDIKGTIELLKYYRQTFIDETFFSSGVRLLRETGVQVTRG